MNYGIDDLPIVVTTFGASAWAYEDVIISDRGKLVATVTYKDGDLASVLRRHEGTDHHDPAEDPSESGHRSLRALRALLCQRDGGQALHPVWLTHDAQNHIVPTLIRQER